MIDSEQAKLRENQFAERLRENLAIVKSAGQIQAEDDATELRRLTGGKMLRNEMEAKYPLAKSISLRIAPKTGLFGKTKLPLVLTGRTVVRLEKFVADGADAEPISLTELNAILAKQADVTNRTNCEAVIGLFSPTDWTEEASGFVRNDPPGSGWASGSVYPILIGPEITELQWDKDNAKLTEHVQLFCGLNESERIKICTQAMERDIIVQDFVRLDKIVEEKGFDIALVTKVAKLLAAQSDKLALSNVAGVGAVLKKRI